MTKTILKKYARLIAAVGGNVQKGQGVMLYASADQAPFAAMVAEECYKCGAKWVSMNWSYQKLTKIDNRYQSVKTLGEVPQYIEEKFKMYVDKNPAMIHIISDDPDGLKGINQDKMQKAHIARYKVLKKYHDLMDNKYQWTIAAVPSPEWAKKVFPKDSKSAAMKKLWDAILKTVHVTADNDPVDEWRQHNEKFKKRSAALNDYKFEYLEYKSSNGTDFKCWLNPKGIWKGGCDKTLSGVVHNPNLPTEEIFTSPIKGKAEGKLVSTMPLSYQGQLIENFWFEFVDGKIVKYGAEKNENLIEKMITSDENAGYIGELALVPYSSPINQAGVLFYNTLFDENASCHVALGRGFTDCLEGYESMTREEHIEAGVNDSMIHVDFMIGAKDMSIKGYKNGKSVDIFVNGEWVI